jgi:hypothetical protein
VMPKSSSGRPSLKKRKRSYKGKRVKNAAFRMVLSNPSFVIAINATNSRNSRIKLGNAGFQRLFDGEEHESAMQHRMDGYDSSWRHMKGLLDVCTFSFIMSTYRA